MAITLFTYASLSVILAPKSIDDTGGPLYYRGIGFMAEPENSLDVVIYGNSDVYSGFIPAVLYKQYGYTSYASGRPSQEMKNILPLLQETLEEQNPKLVILESDCFFSNNTSKIDTTNIMFAPFVYHSRWKELSKKDFITLPKRTVSRDIHKGYIPSKAIFDSTEHANYMSDEKQPAMEISKKNKEYIKDFINLCNSKSIPVLILTLPTPSSWNSAKHNCVNELADSLNISYIDMNFSYEDHNIDLSRDFRDSGDHMNIYGAEKATNYIGDYISQNYKMINNTKQSANEKKHWNKVVAAIEKAL